jgi:4-amino-4-deoxy-L-arabinose transferase-like glycosyltransferase
MADALAPNPVPIPARGRTLLSFWRILGLIALGGVGVRVAYTLTIGRRLHFGSDSLWYQLTGSGIWGGYGYVDPSALIAHGQRVPTANFPPAYPALIALVHGVGFGSPTSLQILGALLGGVTVVLAGILARRVAGAGIGLLVAALVAGWPALIAADGSVMAESLATPLVLWSLLAVDSARRHGRAWRWAIAGVPLGLAGLTRSELPLLAVILVAMAAVMKSADGEPGRRRRLASGLLTLGVAAAFLVPWSVSRVAALGGEAILPTNGAKALAGGNCPETYYGSDLGGWRFSCVQRAIGRVADEKGQTIDARRAALSYAENHLSRLPVVVVARELRTFGAWSPKVLDSDEVQESRDATWQRLAWWVTVLSLPLSAAGCVQLWRRNVLVLAPLFTIVVATAISIGNQRFRLPAEPILILGIVLACQAIGRAFSGAGAADHQTSPGRHSQVKGSEKASVAPVSSVVSAAIPGTRAIPAILP